MLKALHLADVGGDPTEDGRQVRNGLLYRSSALHKLRVMEQARLEALGLQHIIDLREPGASERRPDAIVAKVLTLLPVGLGKLNTIRARDIWLRKLNWQALAHPRIYAEVLEENGPLFQRFLESLLDHPLPALVHCTAGKDRTGMMVAVLQLALGVSHSRIVAGYMAIHPHLEEHFPRRIKALVQLLGGPPLACSVRPEYMEGMLQHIIEKYGGGDGYLHSIQFGRAAELRTRFLHGMACTEV